MPSGGAAPRPSPTTAGCCADLLASFQALSVARLHPSSLPQNPARVGWALSPHFPSAVLCCLPAAPLLTPPRPPLAAAPTSLHALAPLSAPRTTPELSEGAALRAASSTAAYALRSARFFFPGGTAQPSSPTAGCCPDLLASLRPHPRLGLQFSSLLQGQALGWAPFLAAISSPSCPVMLSQRRSTSDPLAHRRLPRPWATSTACRCRSPACRTCSNDVFIAARHCDERSASVRAARSASPFCALSP